MIELKHVSKVFETAGGRVEALKDISLTIPDGDVYGIIGMSGAGKSTLVRCINMLERPTSGEVIVNGKRLDTMSPAQLRAARRDITMIFQRFNLLMQRNCLHHLKLYRWVMYGVQIVPREVDIVSLCSAILISLERHPIWQKSN